jgi:regulatory protein YycH of two-component signal transduction system YycFG
MNNYYYPYNNFNQTYLSSFDRQAWERERHHAEQQKNIADLMKATKDLIDAFNKVSPEYQNQANLAFFSVLCDEMNKRNGGQYR